jgi:hypothetical protein
VPDGILPRSAFAVFRRRTGTSERVARIGFVLSEWGHGLVVRSVAMEARFSKSPRRSGIVATECWSERFGANTDPNPASRSMATAVPLRRACCQSLRAIGSGLIFVVCHLPRRHAGAPALGRKVSDEFTVPVCSIAMMDTAWRLKSQRASRRRALLSDI